MKHSWNELTVKEYFELNDLLSSKMDYVTKCAAIVALLEGRSIDDVMDYPLNDYVKKVEGIAFIKEEIPPVSITPNLKINGRDYLVNLEISKMTASEYIDFVTLSEQPIEENMSKILALFIHPAKRVKSFFGLRLERDKSIEVLEVAKELEEHLPITVASSLMLFFCKVYRTSVAYMVTSLERQIAREKRRLKWRRALRLKITGIGLDVLIELEKKLIEIGKRYLAST